MKKIILIAALVFAGISAFAQPPSKGRDGHQGPPPKAKQGQHPPQGPKGDLMQDFLTPIPNLMLSQREKLTDIFTKEKEDIDKQISKRREAEEKYRYAVTEKDIEKRDKEFQKIEKKIDSIKEKSDKKVKKTLNDEQYAVFIEKRNELRLKEKPGKPLDKKKEKGKKDKKGKKGGDDKKGKKMPPRTTR